ncbi:MAG TPA: hypothetical protein VE974_20460 [Thermoanaerobaculia bacterium]|nr:hypothetical protein [Thermoanaerobaculia bacterium]
MPKIRDLGINVIPETMRPPEVGGGGGCGRTYWDCGPDSPAAYYGGGGGGCGGSHWDCGPDSPAAYYGGGGCGRTYQHCGPLSPDYGGGQGRQYYGPDSPQCYQRPQNYTYDFTRTQPTSPGCGDCTPSGGCTPSPQPPGGGLTREAIAQLRAHLYKQLDQLEEYEKNIGPKTKEAIDAREKELKAELDELARRRKELDK